MPGTVTFGTSVTVALLALTGAALFTWVPRLRAIKALQYFVLPLLLTGFAGLMLVAIGGYSLGGALSSGFAYINHVIGMTVPAIAGVIALVTGVVAVVILICDMVDGKPEKKGVFAALVTPVTATAIPAPFGPIVLAALALPVTFVAALLRALFGLG